MLAKGIVSYSHLSNIEAGRYEPSDEILVALAKRLKVPEEYLLKSKEKDNYLEEFLVLLKMNIDTTKLDKAEQVITAIEEQYKYINSTYQETFYFLLKSYYDYKNKNSSNSIKILETEVLPLLENINIESLPSDFKEIYYYMKGIKCFFEEDFHCSYLYFLKQLPLAKTNLSKAIANFNIGLTLFKMNNFHSANYYVEKSLDYYLHERLWHKTAGADNLLGVTYLKLNDYKNAEKHLLNALNISKQYGLTSLESYILHNLGLLYQKNQDLNRGLDFYSNSLNLKKELGQKDASVLMTYYAIIEIYIEMGLFDHATRILQESKEYLRGVENIQSLKVVEARLNLKLKQNEVFEGLMMESIEYFTNRNNWELVRDTAEELGDYYHSIKKYKLASKYFKNALSANKFLNQEGENEKS